MVSRLFAFLMSSRLEVEGKAGSLDKQSAAVAEDESCTTMVCPCSNKAEGGQAKKVMLKWATNLLDVLQHTIIPPEDFGRAFKVREAGA